MPNMTQFRWFWAWDDEKEENWLREMAQKGWHFVQVVFPGNYIFMQDTPQDIVYRLDFFTGNRDKTDYLQLFLDAGWEYAGQYGSWQYFRKPAAEGQANEIFTDNESKVKKYQRILGILVLTVCSPIGIYMSSALRHREESFFIVIFFFWFVFIMLGVLAIIKLFQRINQLKRH
jgi:hypothetical protein